jgi:large subunit ribosomal protein L9
MQVILMDKVVNLGGLGDIVKVKEGYARNYLIPKGFAKRATEENKKVFEARRAELERIAAEKLAAAQAKAAKLEGMKIELVRKAGVDGRLFGSVSAADIVEGLAAQGVEIEKRDSLAGQYLPKHGVSLAFGLCLRRQKHENEVHLLPRCLDFKLFHLPDYQGWGWNAFKPGQFFFIGLAGKKIQPQAVES